MKKKIKWLLFSIGMVLIIYIIAIVISIWNYGEKDEKQSADVAIVLGAATSNGEVAPIFQERINHGIWLYQNGFVKTLIFTGGIGEENEKCEL